MIGGRGVVRRITIGMCSGIGVAARDPSRGVEATVGDGAGGCRRSRDADAGTKITGAGGGGGVSGGMGPKGSSGLEGREGELTLEGWEGREGGGDFTWWAVRFVSHVGKHNDDGVGGKTHGSIRP